MAWSRTTTRLLLLSMIYLTSPTLGGREEGGETCRVGTAGARDMALGIADPSKRLAFTRLRGGGGGGEERPKVEFLVISASLFLSLPPATRPAMCTIPRPSCIRGHPFFFGRGRQPSTSGRTRPKRWLMKLIPTCLHFAACIR